MGNRVADFLLWLPDRDDHDGRSPAEVPLVVFPPATGWARW